MAVQQIQRPSPNNPTGNGFNQFGLGMNNGLDQGGAGSGLIGGDLGHVTSPGRTPIDNDSRGPVNDASVIDPSTGNIKSTVTPRPAR